MACPLIEGWTERVIYQLYSNGTPQVLTGGEVTISVRNYQNVTVNVLGTANILDDTTGKVYFDPAPTDLVASNSPYLVRWKFTNSGGRVSYFPNSETPEIWNVKSA